MTPINAQTPDANVHPLQHPFSKSSLMTWLAAGFSVWLVATLGLAWLGDLFIESGLAVYIVFSLAACGAFIGIFAFLGKRLGLSKSALLPAAATFSIAGMLGEVVVMITFPMLVPALSATSAAPFAAFLFFGYSALLGYALYGSR